MAFCILFEKKVIMKPKKVLYTIILLFFFSALNAQHITTTTIDQLYKRTTKSDTTFIINFWATWCAPCVEELPGFEKLSEAYKTDKIKVLLVSLDYTSQIEKALKPFIKKQNFQNEVLLLREDDQQAFIDKVDSSWSGALPATIFIRQDKKAFFEKTFTYVELVNTYKNFKQ